MEAQSKWAAEQWNRHIAQCVIEYVTDRRRFEGLPPPKTPEELATIVAEYERLSDDVDAFRRFLREELPRSRPITHPGPEQN
jgi:hypothetical protein